jgi:hypothetical protein
MVEVELSRDRYQTDPFQVGEQIFLRPRQLKVFPAPAGEAPAAGDGKVAAL